MKKQYTTLKKIKGKQGGILGFNTIVLIERTTYETGRPKKILQGWIAELDGDLELVCDEDLLISLYEYRRVK